MYGLAMSQETRKASSGRFHLSMKLTKSVVSLGTGHYLSRGGEAGAI